MDIRHKKRLQWCGIGWMDSNSGFRSCSPVPRLSILLVSLVWISLPFASFAVPVTYQPAALDADSVNNSLTAEPNPRLSFGCRYKAVFYSIGETVPTDEPCLRCACKNSAVVCKLRICSDVPNVPPPGCLVVHKAKTCCAELVCPESRKFSSSREQRLSTGNNNSDSIIPTPPGQGFCVMDGTVYAEGSAMKSSTLCEYCFCIRGEMKCSTPQCVIPLNGCRPRYRSYACCPTNYDCNESNATAILQTIPSSTPIPAFLKGCQVRGQFVHEGEPVLPMHLDPDKNLTNPCETCFCMGGLVRCRRLECDPPMPGCVPVMVEGHCCPDHYECGATTALPEPDPSYPSSLEISQASARNQLGESAETNSNITDTLEKGTPKPQEPFEVHSATVAPSIPQIQSLVQSGSSAELVLNATANHGKSRSDIGSREERRNKDKVDYKTSYEDDEKDDLGPVPISLEPRDQDFMSSISFDETTTDATAVTSLDIEPEGVTVIQIDEQSLGLSEIVTEMDNEVFEHTTLLASPAELVERDTEEVINTTQSPSPSPETHSTTTSQPMSPVTEEITIRPNATTPAFTTQIPTTSVPPTVDATLTQVHFIPFGAEDAVINPNKENYEARSPQNTNLPIKITYDREPPGKMSLIPPTPPRGYVHVPLLPSPESIIGPNPMSTGPLEAISTISDPFLPKHDLRNAIMDVPVSTSLYNNGYYQNGIITNAQNPNSNSSFPGQVFDDSSERILGTDDSKPMNESETEPKPELREDLEKPGMFNIQDFKNPLRTYSKFGIHDSPFYRYEDPNEPNAHATSKKKDKDDRGYAESAPSAPSHRMTEGTGSNFQHQGYSKTKHTPFLDYELDPVMYEEDDLDLTSFERSEPQDFFTNYERGKVTTRDPIIVTPSSIHTHAYRNSMSTGPSPTRDAGFKPVVAFPFKTSRNPSDSFLSLGLKLSGCNIYGKMYTLGNVIRELSSSCVRCECTEAGVQCSELEC